MVGKEGINLIIGLPKEIKNHEYRVTLTPHGTASLVREGHEVLVQGGAGVGSGFPDDQYLGEGARVIDGPERVDTIQPKSGGER